LCSGFWPCADELVEDYPGVWDESRDSFTPESLKFLKEQCVEEEALGRLSHPFIDLLPGMYSMLIHTVPKPHSEKLRMVVNHSAGEFSLNSMIDCDAVGIHLDNVHDLGRNLLTATANNQQVVPWLFKSDVSQAYCRLPVHPRWQIKQVVTLDGQRHVDHCNNFGNHAGGFLWCSFFGLVLWIAINIKAILDLLAYVDDTFGQDSDPHLIYYAPYDTYYPSKQAHLLYLLDDLGIPHEKRKQEFGHVLVIIGFSVDANAMTITLSHDAQMELVHSVRSFIHDAPGRRRKLVEWLRLLGYANWGLNVAPLLRPALQSTWEKTRGKKFSQAGITINKAVTHDLLWFAKMLERQHTISLLHARAWQPDDVDLVFYTDASGTGLGFWCPFLWKGYVSGCPPLPDDLPDGRTFWYEALTVVSALHHAVSTASPPSRLLIFTDNLNTVQIFESLRAHGPYNTLLLFAIELLLTQC
jgi:hypothetical protein